MKYIAKAIQLRNKIKKVTATDSKIFIYILKKCVSSRILSYFKENKNKFKKPEMLFPIRFAYSKS